MAAHCLELASLTVSAHRRELASLTVAALVLPSEAVKTVVAHCRHPTDEEVKAVAAHCLVLTSLTVSAPPGAHQPHRVGALPGAHQPHRVGGALP